MAGENREKLLLQMYDQMFNDINRHIMVVWQSVGVVVGAFAVLALVEKQVITLDVAAALIVLICGWLFAHLSDASYWYNRNLAIIANIERQFLVADDLKDIHYYFGAHRPKNRMIMHLQIQYLLGMGIAMIVLLFHAWTRVVPGFQLPLAWSNFDLMRCLPYLLVVACAIVVTLVHKNRRKSYEEFLTNSPGIKVNIAGVKYGVGHGHKELDQTPTQEGPKSK